MIPNKKTKPHAINCAIKGCSDPGSYKAPLSPMAPNQYIWLCLNHVREHNANWNWLGNCSEEEVERRIRFATIWERPTWPLGKGPAVMRKKGSKTAPSPKAVTLPPSILKALDLMEIELPVTLTKIKKRYRELAKKYHPDTNHEPKKTVEKFHQLQDAFHVLEAYYTAQSQT
ncbi:MAG: hypothetical protein EOM37_05180 [Proteobacteria bacterium]|jgi:hypothetical protein|nr:J domain-containing protein [Alphaproteobacteria bacterium]NCC03425.1 hypothetical protein [Pseudomonadota bacterium]